MDFSACFRFVFIMAIGRGLYADDNCGCSVKDQCKQINNWTTGEHLKKVVMTTDLTSNYTDWLWDTLTTVLVLNKSLENQSDLMCYTHSQGKQYGFFVDVPSSYDTTELNGFVTQSVQDVNNLHADVVALNFIQLIGDCGNSRQHAQSISDSVELVISGIHRTAPNVTVLCVLPWKPPCYDSDCEVTTKMAAICDGLILNLDSFSTYCQESCTAKPIVPYNKLMLAIEDYVSMGFKVSQILISIPWHGYNYTCSSGDVLDGSENIPICNLKSETVNSKKVCKFKDSRSKVNLGQLIQGHPDLTHQEKTYSVADQSAWFTTKNADNTSNLIWFEDIVSLKKKYEVVNMFALKGVVIYTADDLSYTHVHTDGQHDMSEFMWAWLVHEVMMEGKVPTTHDDEQMSYTGTAVGVGVGMFLFGVLAGTIIGCFVFRQGGVISRRYRQFGSDTLADEYHDDL